MKISIEQKSQKYILQIKLNKEETVDKYSYGVLTNNNFEELSDVNQMHINDDTILKYSVLTETPISEWLKKEHNESEIIMILNSIIRAYESAESAALPVESFLLNEKYVFVNDKKSSVKLIYVPLNHFKSEDRIEHLIKYVVENTVADTPSKVLALLKKSRFTLNDIKTNLEEASGKVKIQKIEKVFVENENGNIVPNNERKDFVMPNKNIISNVESIDSTEEKRNTMLSGNSVQVKENDLAKIPFQKPGNNIARLPLGTEKSMDILIPGGGTIQTLDLKKNSKGKEPKSGGKKFHYVNLTDLVVNMIKKGKEKKEETESNNHLPQNEDFEVPANKTPADVDNKIIEKNKRQNKKKKDKKSKDSNAVQNNKPLSVNDEIIQIPTETISNVAKDDQAQRVKATRRAQEAQIQKAEAARRAQDVQAQKAEAARRAQEAQAQKAEAARRAQEAQAQKAEATRRTSETNQNRQIQDVQIAREELVRDAENLLKERENVIDNSSNENALSNKKSTENSLFIQSDYINVDNDKSDGSIKIYVNIPKSEIEKAKLPLGNNADNNDPIYPKLVRLKTNEGIYINKPVFKIGKEKSAVDYFINNQVISRLHAMICCHGGKYYIVDTKSTNKTFLNGVKCRSNYDYELADGDIIKLANEEFKFIKYSFDVKQPE